MHECQAIFTLVSCGTHRVNRALKLDMSKAYDRVEWRFLEAIIDKLGFSRKWTKLILRCVTSVSYRIKFNGETIDTIIRETTDTIIPSRGIRQGDPLSPYLFVIVAQGLSSLLKSYCAQGKIKGLKMANRGLTITHFFFADDSLVFFKADSDSCKAVKKCLEYYEKVSGQVINFEKSALSFSPVTLSINQKRVKQVLKIR